MKIDGARNGEKDTHIIKSDISFFKRRCRLRSKRVRARVIFSAESGTLACMKFLRAERWPLFLHLGAACVSLSLRERRAGEKSHHRHFSYNLFGACHQHHQQQIQT
jgi:hypothetical protein